MHNNNCNFSLVWLIVFGLLMLSTTVASAASVKELMAARIPTLNSLKDQGVIGENNKGFLEFRGAKKEQQLVADENRDRTQVYKAIAQNQDASAALVGQRRAKMIADNGKKGHWFQDPLGNWYRR